MRLLKFVLCLSLSLPASVFAQKSAEAYFSPEFAATSAAAFIKNAKTIKGLLDGLGSTLSTTELENTLAILKKNNIDVNTELPIFEANGNELTWKSISMKISDDGRVVLNGGTLAKYTHGTFDIYLSNLLSAQKNSSLYSLAIPNAMAFGEGGFTPGTILLTLGIMAVPGAIVVATVVAATAAAAAAVYLGKEIYESIRENEISCSGKVFAIRKKTRNSAKLATSKTDSLSNEVVSQVIGKKVNACTPDLAKELTSKIKASKVSVPATPTKTIR